MPFKSKKQQSYLWAKEPAIAKKWTKEPEIAKRWTKEHGSYKRGGRVKKAKGGKVNAKSGK